MIIMMGIVIKIKIKIKIMVVKTSHADFGVIGMRLSMLKRKLVPKKETCQMQKQQIDRLVRWLRLWWEGSSKWRAEGTKVAG